MQQISVLTRHNKPSICCIYLFLTLYIFKNLVIFDWLQDECPIPYSMDGWTCHAMSGKRLQKKKTGQLILEAGQSSLAQTCMKLSVRFLTYMQHLMLSCSSMILFQAIFRKSVSGLYRLCFSVWLTPQFLFEKRYFFMPNITYTSVAPGELWQDYWNIIMPRRTLKKLAVSCSTSHGVIPTSAWLVKTRPAVFNYWVLFADADLFFQELVFYCVYQILVHFMDIISKENQQLPQRTKMCANCTQHVFSWGGSLSNNIAAAVVDRN